MSKTGEEASSAEPRNSLGHGGQRAAVKRVRPRRATTRPTNQIKYFTSTTHAARNADKQRGGGDKQPSGTRRVSPGMKACSGTLAAAAAAA